MIILTIRLYWVQWNVIKIDGDQAPPRLPHWSIISSSRHPSRFHSCNLYICPEGGSRLQSISNFKTQIIGIWKMGWPPKLLVMYKQYSKGKAPPTLVNCPRRWSLFFIFVFLCWSSTNKYQKYKSVELGDRLPPPPLPPSLEQVWTILSLEHLRLEQNNLHFTPEILEEFMQPMFYCLRGTRSHLRRWL